jgi:hypothetical protein
VVLLTSSVREIRGALPDSGQNAFSHPHRELAVRGPSARPVGDPVIFFSPHAHQQPSNLGVNELKLAAGFPLGHISFLDFVPHLQPIPLALAGLDPLFHGPSGHLEERTFLFCGSPYKSLDKFPQRA